MQMVPNYPKHDIWLMWLGFSMESSWIADVHYNKLLTFFGPLSYGGSIKLPFPVCLSVRQFGIFLKNVYPPHGGYTYDIHENCLIFKTPHPCASTSKLFPPPWPWTFKSRHIQIDHVFYCSIFPTNKAVALLKEELRGELLGKRGVTILSGGCNFYIKNKLKSEIFHDKKFL